MSAFLNATVDAWFQLLANQLTSLFDGSDASIAALGAVIDNTAVAFAVNQPTIRELQPILEKALYGYMIPSAWNASTLNVLVSPRNSIQLWIMLNLSSAFHCVRHDLFQDSKSFTLTRVEPTMGWPKAPARQGAMAGTQET